MQYENDSLREGHLKGHYFFTTISNTVIDLKGEDD